LAFAPGSVVVVNGTAYAKTRQPSFVVVATPGATSDLILRGNKVIGSKIVGVVVEGSTGSATFRLPPGAKLGTYTITAQTSGLNSNVLSFKIAARIPKPKPPRKPKTKIKTAQASSVAVKTAIRVQHNAVQAHQVQTAAASNGNVIDQAVHSLVQYPLLFKNKKKGD
jgi:hypothetical protein